MFLTFIQASSGERWSFDVTDDAGSRAAAEWLYENPEAQKAFELLGHLKTLPRDKAVMTVNSRWACIYSDRETKKT